MTKVEGLDFSKFMFDNEFAEEWLFEIIISELDIKYGTT